MGHPDPRPWIEPGINKGRRATGANTIDIHEENGRTDAVEATPAADAVASRSHESVEVQGCWEHPDDLRGPQMTVPHWIGPTPLSSLPDGWRMGYDKDSGRPFFWHEGDPDSTTWEDPRSTAADLEDADCEDADAFGQDYGEQEMEEDDAVEHDEIDGEAAIVAYGSIDLKPPHASSKDPLQEFFETATMQADPVPAKGRKNKRRSCDYWSNSVDNASASAHGEPSFRQPHSFPRSRSPTSSNHDSTNENTVNLLRSLGLSETAGALATDKWKTVFASPDDILVRALAEALAVGYDRRQELRRRLTDLSKR